MNQGFQDIPPDFNISIEELKLNSTWYSLDAGSTTYNFTGLTGTINQSAWDAFPEGPVTIRFYANDSLGNVNFTEVK